MTFEVVVVVDADGPQGLERVLVVARDLLPYLEEPGAGGADRGDEQVLFAREVAVKCRFGDAGRLREIGGADASVALSCEDAARALDDLAAALGGGEATCPRMDHATSC